MLIAGEVAAGEVVAQHLREVVRRIHTEDRAQYLIDWKDNYVYALMTHRLGSAIMSIVRTQHEQHCEK